MMVVKFLSFIASGSGRGNQTCKNSVIVPGQRVDVILESLQKLQKRKPSREILLETKIGRAVNKLCKHDHGDVKELARSILKSWNQYYREVKQRQPTEVRCDKNVEHFRDKARTMISKAMGRDVSLFLNSIELI